MCTIAYTAARIGYLNKLGRYWWHDPELIAGPCGTVAAISELYYGCVENGEPIDEYWIHDPSLDISAGWERSFNIKWYNSNNPTL